MLLIIILVIVSFPAHAQYAEYDNFSTLKKQYNGSSYTPQNGDIYDPPTVAILSLLIPGCGQFITKEPGRGMFFTGAALTSVGVYIYCRNKSSEYTYDYSVYGHQTVKEPSKSYAYIGISALFAYIAIAAWSYYDAYQIARVKNLYHREVRLTPVVSLMKTETNTMAPFAGASISFVF